LIHVTQRADASHKIGKLKSKMAYRSLRLSALVLTAIFSPTPRPISARPKTWKNGCSEPDGNTRATRAA
jgi:hypothetical protein